MNSRIEDPPGETTDSGWRNLLRRLMRWRNGSETLRDTIEELIEQEDAAPTQNSPEVDLLRNTLSVRDVTVADVMVPHADIVAVDVNATLEEVARLMSESRHSRLPVHGGRLDDVIGMVHIKDC